MQARAIDHVNIRIPEDRVEDSIEFYRDKLGFEPENLDDYREGDRGLFSFRLGENCLIHIRPIDPDEFREPEKENYDHCCVVVEHDIEEVKELLDDQGVEIEREGNPLGATGRNPAVYVTDPFGYLMEIKQAN